LVHGVADAGRHHHWSLHEAVEYIKKNIRLEGRHQPSVADSKAVSPSVRSTRAEGHVQHLPRHARHWRLRSSNPFVFIGYLISIATLRLYFSYIFFMA
jgi:hypothetical protein